MFHCLSSFFFCHCVVCSLSIYDGIFTLYCRKHFPVLSRSWFFTGFVTRLTRRVSLVEQELFTLPEHLRSPTVFSGVRVTRSIVVCVCFVDRRLSFCTFSFGHCIVCPSSIYEFWLHLWYLPTLLFYFSFYYLDFKWLWYKSNTTFYISNVYWILMFAIYLQPGYSYTFQ